MQNGKKYNLSHAAREKYKQHHHHIAPDLRDRHCYQSPEADVFCLGKIIQSLHVYTIYARSESSS